MHRDKVAFVLSGTRGDVQPFLVLASALAAQRHPVVILTHQSFQAMVEQRGLQCRLLARNPTDLLVRADGGSALRLDRGLAHTIIDSARYVRRAQPLLSSLMDSAFYALSDVRLAVAGLPALWMDAVAPVAGCKLLWSFLQPVTRTAAWPSAILPMQNSSRPINRLSHQVAATLTARPWRGTYARWQRARNAPAREVNPLQNIEQQSVLYGFSKYVVPAPADWPEGHCGRGYWRSADSPPLPAEIDEFIARRSRVIYVGFGSPGTRADIDLLALANRLDVGIVHQGTSPKSDQVLPVADVPHASLFPKMQVVVHHGGAGTTSEALHAGVPQVIVPGAVDQYFWAGRCASLGVAPEPLPQTYLNARLLARRIEQAIQVPTMVPAAKELAHQLNGESGVAAAIHAIGTATSG